MIRKTLSDKVVFEHLPEVCEGEVFRKSTLGRGTSECKDLEVRRCLECLYNGTEISTAKTE